MRRIGLAVGLVLALVLAPLAADAQLIARPVKIGMLCAGVCPFGGPAAGDRPLIEALERVGLVQGRSLVWDLGGVVADENEINTEAAKLVSRRPDLILVWVASVTSLWGCTARASTSS